MCAWRARARGEKDTAICEDVKLHKLICATEMLCAGAPEDVVCRFCLEQGM